MSDFEALLAELGDIETTMTKALPSDDGDEKIQAAAEGEGDAHDEPDADNAGGPADGDDDDKGDGMAKSFTLTLDDGTEMEAIDGTEMVKALSARVDKAEVGTHQALKAAVGLLAKQGQALASQGSMIKSLQDEVARLRGQPAPRKTVVSVHERTSVADGDPMAKSHGDEGMNVEQFMLKAHQAFDAGKLNGRELNTIDVCRRERQPVPEAIVAKVLG